MPHKTAIRLATLSNHPLTVPASEESMSQAEAHVSDRQEMPVPDDEIVAGNTSHTRPENRAFYPALDGLRAIAFLMVFCVHYIYMPWGWAGVDVFFVLSGFLITGILFDSLDDLHRVRNFYVRRILRIFPLYYGVMLLLLPFIYGQLSWSWLLWPAYLGNYARFFHPYVVDTPAGNLADFQLILQVGNHARLYLGHFWSLCVEEQFYLIWPWIVFSIRDRRKLLWICAASIPVCLAARVMGHHLLPLWMLHSEVLARATPFRFDALLLGGCIALWLRGPHADLLLRAARIAWPPVLAALFLWAALTPGHFWQQPYTYPTGVFTWGLLGIDFLSALVIVLAIQPRSIVYRVLNLRALRWLGRISYGAYVLHDIPHALYFSLAQAFFPTHAKRMGPLIALISTCFLAWLSFRFFESRFLDLKERWTIRR
jgi:peptidoglycan/LPS O-acetylase OafA/YrhL